MDDRSDRLAFGLVTVGLLSCLAGAVDACGLLILKDLFVSFMSGNTTSLGAAIGHRDVPRILLILSIVAVFVGGAAAGTTLAIVAGRRHLPVVVFTVAGLLAIPIAFPAATIYAMTFAMGVLNAAMDHAGSVSVSITYITGTLVKLGKGLGQLICGRAEDMAWLEQAVPWVGILSGSAVATLCLSMFGHATMAALPVIALALAIAFWFLVPRGPARPA